MRQNSLFNYLFIAIFFTSCIGQRKMNAVRESLISIKAAQENEKSKLSGLSGISGSKLGEGKIDSVVQYRILARLKGYEQVSDFYGSKADSVDLLLKSKKLFRKQYKAWILPMLDSLRQNNEKYAERLTLYLMIEEGLTVANYNLYDLGAFFGPGKYVIPEDKLDSALISFEPIIDSLIVFSNKYVNQRRTASVIILGFADGTGFSDEGPLMDTLIEKIGTRDVTQKQLNTKLSELRAEELSKQLVQLFVKKSAAFQDPGKLKIEYIYQGKGEVYPFPHINDYTVDDHRRRIVLCYWVVLPD